MSLACVGSTRIVPATLGLPPLTGVCFPCLHCSGSRLLYRERALSWVRFQFSGTPQKRGLGWACILCLPQPEQLRPPGAGRAHSPQVRCAFSPPRSQPQSPCAPWVRLVSVLQSWSLATTLPADVNCPESQEVFGQKLEACLQFGRGAISGTKFAPFPSPLPPASGGRWAGPLRARSSLELLSPFVCEWPAG